MTKALICGITGQDGAYLAKFLLSKGYSVYGTSRDAQVSKFENLSRLSINDAVDVHSMSMIDFRSVLQVLTAIEPDEIYNFSGQSSVGLSFQQPVETLESISVGTLNLLEVVRYLNKPIKIYNAASSECFGDTGSNGADEDSPFRPRSPYAVAKATAYWEVANYRDAYNLYACSGLLFNHESPLRPERFVTKKIIRAATRIAAGSNEKLHLGNIEIRRDWGWAPEYVEAMWKMLQLEQPQDFVIATGKSHSLQEFVATSFTCLDLDWREHVVTDKSLLRPSEISEGKGIPAKAEKILHWRAQYSMQDVVAMMVDAELKKEQDNS